MGRKYIPVLTIILILIAGVELHGQEGYRIDLRITGDEDSIVTLAYHMGDKQYIKDTCRTDHTGSAVFTGSSPLDKGLYLVVMPDNRYFEIIISDDQKFGIECSSDNFINTLKFSGSDENTNFLAYQKGWVALQGEASKIRERLNASSQNQDSTAILQKLLKEKEDSMISYLNKVSDDNQGTILAALVKAMLPVKVPEFDIPPGTENPDSLRWIMGYEYNKNHYFDNIDLTDTRLVRTPVLYNKLNTFFTNVIIQVPDSINREIDRVVALTNNNEEMFRFVVVYLFNHFRESQIMGHDAVMVKIADDFYLSGKADWATEDFLKDLRKDIDLLRFNLIGMQAMDLTMDTFEGIPRSLYDIKKDFTILYFWEPECGHCQEATPKLKEFYERNKDKGVEVFAVCTQNNREAWEKYINENTLTWINGWDPQRVSHFDFYYDVISTPTIYILDRNKKIIAKKLPVESLQEFIDNYRKYGN